MTGLISKTAIDGLIANTLSLGLALMKLMSAQVTMNYKSTLIHSLHDVCF
jgi:hypothetical protein